MRRYIVPVIALTLAAAPVAEAQTPRGERGARMGQMMGMGGGPGAGTLANPAARVLTHRDELGLSSSQVRQLQQLQTQHQTRNEPLLEQVRAARPAGAARGARGAGITPEQRAQMQQRRAEMQQRRDQTTPEQREQMRAQMQQFRERMQQASPEERERIRSEMQAEMQARGMQPGWGAPTLDPEMRARLEALQPVLQQLRDNNEQARREVQAVLTPEQHARLQELQAQRTDQLRQRAEQGRDRAAGQMLRRGARR